MDLRACARCASLDLHGQTLGEGLAVGMEGMATVCAECGFQGAPLLFERDEDYIAFREAQRGPPGHERTAREAAAEADREAEEAAEEASHEPLPAELEGPLAPFRVPVVPWLVFAVGAVSFVLGLFTLGSSGGLDPTRRGRIGFAGLPLVLVGLGLMLVAWRLTHRQKGSS